MGAGSPGLLRTLSSVAQLPPTSQLDQLHTHNKKTHPTLKISLEATTGPLGPESRVQCERVCGGGGRLGIWCDDEGLLSFLLEPQ